jgi:hypothetical protein
MRTKTKERATPIADDIAADIMTAEQVAHRLQVTRAFIFEKTRSRCPKPIPAIRIGKYLRFNWASVAAWLAKQEGTATQKRTYRRRRKQKEGAV